jgi:hypothetical protein
MASDNLSIVWLPVNQAYAVLWFEVLLRIFNDREDAEYYVSELRRGTEVSNGQ